MLVTWPIGTKTRRRGCTSTTMPSTRGGWWPLRSAMTTSRTRPTWSALGSSTVRPASRARKIRIVVPVAMIAEITAGTVLDRGRWAGGDERDSADVLVSAGMSVLDKFRLDGKVAVVTGASSGLGVAFARALAEAGADVALGARRVDRLEQTREMVSSLGRRAIAVATDVAKPEDCERLVAAAVAELGGVDILVNNAGVGTAVPATRETPEQFRVGHRHQPQRLLLDGAGLRPRRRGQRHDRQHRQRDRFDDRRPAAGGLLRVEGRPDRV